MSKIDQKNTTTINEPEKDLRGTIQLIRSGNAFVELDTGSESLFVRRENTGCALPGDSVSVRRLPSVGANSADTRLSEAQVVHVTKRARTELTGVLRKARHGVAFEATDPRISITIHLRDVAGAKADDRVVLRLDKHTTNKPQGTLQGCVVRTLGKQGDASTDHALVANEYRLPGRFPKPVRTEARDLGFELQDAVGRLDLRDRLVFTIDPEGSRDFDDALSVRRLHDGLWEVCVHIADVSHLVTPGSALDNEAFSRACSTYLPGQVTPMLPEELSNELCSLNPDQDRLAFTCILTLTDAGQVRDTRFVETRIRSRKRFTYEEAYRILEGNTPQAANTNVAKAVRQLGRLADMLRKRRFRDGALEIVTSEITPVLDPSGRLTDIRVTSSDAAHALVEEFMLAANEAACKTLQKAGFDQLFRSHPTPDPDRVAEAVRA
ncbi:MAG: RNB domain-containing ribonuclease, partial [Lentisphaeria bacterium]|nr:RNB domain-containing ribonuclease [Lentisphaeria bacterium]